MAATVKDKYGNVFNEAQILEKLKRYNKPGEPNHEKYVQLLAEVQAKNASANATTTPAPAPVFSSTPPGQPLSPYLQKAKNDLQGQVSRGSIQQWQADAELERLKGVEAQTAPQFPTNVPLSTPSDILNVVSQAGKAGATAGNILSNPNVSGPLGSQNVSVDPLTGQPRVTQTLSTGNESVLGGIQGTALSASDVAKQLLQPGGALYSAIQSAAPIQAFSDPELENAVYGQLTRGFDEQKAREQEQLQQNLANRGIPLGSQLSNQLIGDFAKNWNQRFDQARQQAVEQGRSSALSRQQAGISGLGAISSVLGGLSNIGQGGFYAPSFQSFQSTPYQQPSVQDIFGAIQQGQLAREGMQNDAAMLQAQLAARRGGGGGGGGGTPAPQPSAFSDLPPGGL